MIPVIVKLCESPSRAGGLLIRNYVAYLSLIVLLHDESTLHQK
jgi:hypothetical protein